MSTTRVAAVPLIGAVALKNACDDLEAYNPAIARANTSPRPIGSVLASGAGSVIWFIGRALSRRKSSRRPDLGLFASG